MKSFVLSALSLCTFAVNVYANGYCDGRQTRFDIDNCYRLAIESENQKLSKTLSAIMASPKLTVAQKQSVQQSHVQWANLVNAQCKVSVCVEKSIAQRNGELAYEFSKLK